MVTATKKNLLLQAWSETLAIHADQPAIFAPDGSILRKFREIEAESGELQQKLADLPLGRVLAVQIGNNVRWPALLLAALRQGLVPLPLGRHTEKNELDQVLRSAGAVALVETGQETTDHPLCISPLRDSGDSAKDCANNYANDCANDSANETNEIGPAVECDFLKLTSGTSSAPRMVRFSAAQLVADCSNICETMGIGPGDINFGVIPFSHSYGFSNLLTPLICRGVPLVASDDRMPRAILNGLAATRATVFPGMPLFFEKFTGLTNLPSLDSLRLCISAGAPLSRVVGENFTRSFGLKIHTFYGASECGGIAYDANDDPVYQDGFLGTPLKNVRVDLRPDGSICVESAAVGQGYYPHPDSSVLGNGRFIPSDLLTQTPRGMLMVGRVSDIINVAGRKLNPGEVEARLLEFPGVRQAVVFGVPSPLRNEEPVACIAGEVDESALIQHAQTRLSSWQLPKHFWFVPEIPTNERGKISRRELAAEYLRQSFSK